ncbi:hypothetical protein QUB10_16985 [Microcoleus sp. B5-D4]|uniref:hypothetical protein n=1 Tax=unclassified Microcoleus TaxID=2642155 RepID=UPI002FCF0D93
MSCHNEFPIISEIISLIHITAVKPQVGIGGGFQHPFKNRQDACSTKESTYCGTGILPVPDKGTKYQ